MYRCAFVSLVSCFSGEECHVLLLPGAAYFCVSLKWEQNLTLIHSMYCVMLFSGLVPIMGPQEEYIETVVTCEGDYYDPEFHTHLQNLSKRLQSLLTEGVYVVPF